MPDDPILNELHAVRERLLHEAGGTLHGLVELLRQQELESGRKIVHDVRSGVVLGSAESSADNVAQFPTGTVAPPSN